MALGMVVGYQAHWNTENHDGEIKLRTWFGGGYTTVDLAFDMDGAEEMQLLVDLLRNEYPIWYDSSKKTIRTGHWETVGEGE
jgi:hypothetical protein